MQQYRVAVSYKMYIPQSSAGDESKLILNTQFSKQIASVSNYVLLIRNNLRHIFAKIVCWKTILRPKHSKFRVSRLF